MDARCSRRDRSSITTTNANRKDISTRDMPGLMISLPVMRQYAREVSTSRMLAKDHMRNPNG